MHVLIPKKTSEEASMKKVLFLTLAIIAGVASAWAQYPHVSIAQIQQVPVDSLLVADTLSGFSANSAQPRWTLQTSPYMGDTVEITGVCLAPPKLITYTAWGWTMVLYDTGTVTQWGAILIRGNAPTDTTQMIADGFLNVTTGDIVTMTGVISEFPGSRGFSFTQFQPIPGIPIDIIGTTEPPKPIVKNISDFYHGIFPSGTTPYSTGEPFEAMYVEFHNLTIDNKVNLTRGTFSAVDSLGNEISDYDWSHYFTLGHTSGTVVIAPPDTAWSRIYATIGNGVRIDTLRGIISTSSGSEGPRGYRVSPLYPGDIVFTVLPAPPLVTTHRRNPVVVSSDTFATVSVKVTQQPNGSLPKNVILFYKADTAAFARDTMVFQSSDTTYVGHTPKLPAGTFVKYYVQVADSFGQVVRLANSSTNTGIAADTSKGFFFYTVLDRPLTIQDVQYTPYVNGRSAYQGAVVPLSGIITADTLHIDISPATTGSTSAWYMQSTSEPWSGIWLSPIDSASQAALAALRNGDSVTVTGTVQEQFDVTRLGNITSVVKISSGNPEPAPVALHTGNFNVGNGSPSAEPYEGMLVRFSNVTVTDLNPTYSDPTEYTVNDGTGGVVVQHSGRNRYSNVAADTVFGKTIFQVGNKIGSLTGIVYYSFNQYKFVPRTDADFVDVVLTSVAEKSREIPSAYALDQNFPNPFNPSTTIQYALPHAGNTTLKVYNILGQQVASLVNEFQAPGKYTVKFDASSMASGVYFYRVQSGSYSAIKKMMLIK
jgi:hypothetical protein